MNEVNIQKEVNDLKQIAQNWYTGYKTWIHPDGPNEYVYEEFTEELQMVMLPYIQRLYLTEYLTKPEARELADFVFGQVERLREYGKEIERKNKSRNLGKMVRNSRLSRWLINALSSNGS